MFFFRGEKLPKFITDFFELLQIPNEHLIIINDFVRFKEIVCPPPAFILNTYWTDDHSLVFKSIAENISPASYDKVYLTRRSWHGQVQCFGEDKLEAVFVKNGFHPIAMEQLSLREQIAIMKGAKVVAGINGTALHNILFGNNQDVIVLQRAEKSSSQHVVNEVVNARAYYVQAHANPLPTLHSKGPFMVGMTSHLKDFLQDYGLKVVNVPFEPHKYLKAYLQNYSETYQYEQPNRLLNAINKDTLTVLDLVAVLQMQRYSGTMELLYKFGVKVTSYVQFLPKMSKIHQAFKRRYETYLKRKAPIDYHTSVLL